ncbi:MAG: methylamine utilization protein MauE [Gammaproteobacteria bacterium]|nr:methylamine utilization protein MauE [Gammaproteobacteria bacterium]
MLAVAAGFAVLLGSAAWGKFRNAAGFEAILADYRLLPGSLVRPVARGIPVVEGVLAAAWIIAPWHADAALLASIATVAIMLGYGVAIAANLSRGRSWIDCGCGGGEQLSWVLVGRNAVLATVAVVPLVASGAGVPAWGDLAMALPMFAVGACLYLATGVLVANAAAMRPWAEDPS